MSNISRADTSLTEGWKLALAAANSASSPSRLDPNLHWLDARVAGTAISVLAAAGLWTLDNPSILDGKDVWYRLNLNATGLYRLRFEGLATFAEVWLDDEHVGSSENMFLPLEFPVKLHGGHVLHIVFRNFVLKLKNISGRRARWRTALINDARLRFVRTTMIGHMPGWCPPMETIGPWRPIHLLPDTSAGPEVIVLSSGWSPGGGGHLHVRFRMPQAQAPVLTCAGASVDCTHEGDTHVAYLSLPDVEPWWPHTHGEAVLHEIGILDAGLHHMVGKTGFRSLQLDRGHDGNAFSISVNGKSIFMRGVCWTPPQLNDLSFNEKACRAEFELLREANVNMVRIIGTMFYESEAFFRLADEYGILVWQDLPLANFDYPFEDESFAAIIHAEVDAFLRSTQFSPSLAIVCGGSEIWQQASMLGVPEKIWRQAPFWDGLQDHVHSLRSDVMFFDNSPSGGELPFAVNSGPGHYYGVGAYLRPLEDARRADVQFASECLAFANVPEAASLKSAFGDSGPNHRNWKDGVARDRGAAWDFEDVIAHYSEALYDTNIAALRTSDPERYLAMLRAASAEVMDLVFAEWRRPQSRTRGGLVLLWRDFGPGAGWGIVDASGRPKSAWYALKRAFRSLQILVSDEGVNGLYVHVVNETCQAQPVKVSLRCMRDDGHALTEGRRDILLAPNQFESIAATQLFGAFFDANHAYKFGPAAHDVTVAELHCLESGTLLAQAFHFPQGRRCAQHDTQLNASIGYEHGAHILTLSCQRFAQSVSISSPSWRPSDNYFHLPPNCIRRIALVSHTGAGYQSDDVTISSLNGTSNLTLKVQSS